MELYTVSVTICTVFKKEYIIFAKVMEYVSGDNYCDKWWCNLKLLLYYFTTLISNFIFEEDKGFNFI